MVVYSSASSSSIIYIYLSLTNNTNQHVMPLRQVMSPYGLVASSNPGSTFRFYDYRNLLHRREISSRLMRPERMSKCSYARPPRLKLTAGRQRMSLP